MTTETAEVTIQFVNMPVPPKKFGSIKTAELGYMGALPALLRQFNKGEVCKVEFETTEAGYKNVKRRISFTSTQPAHTPPRQRTNPVDNEHIFITALLKEYIAAGKLDLVTTEIVTAVNTIRDAYRHTLGGLEKQRSDSLDDGTVLMTFIIAELGINHNGSLELAKKLVDAAKWAGADAVKLQKRDVATVYAGQLHLPRESPWGATVGAQKYGLEFNRHQYDEFALYCEQQKMPWFASAWDLLSLSFLRQYSCPYNKIASAMMTNTLFVMEVASEHKQTFASAAMCGDDDVESTVQLFQNFSHRRLLTLMHCVATYPASEADLNLRVIGTLKEKYGLPVGYSGHEASVSPSVMAVVLGAVAVERHITLDRTMYGSDQAASLEPHGFKDMVDQIRKVDTVLGDGIRRITEGEQEVAKKLRYWLR